MSVIDKIREANKGSPIMAVAYARYSSDNQRDESIDAQFRAIEGFAKANNIVIVEKSMQIEQSQLRRMTALNFSV